MYQNVIFQLRKTIKLFGFVTVFFLLMPPLISNNFEAFAIPDLESPKNLQIVGYKLFDTLIMSWDYEGWGVPENFEIWKQVKNQNNDIVQNWIDIAETNSNYYTDKGNFKPGYIYSYKIRACESMYCTEFSNTITRSFFNNPPILMDIQDHTINEDENLLIQFMGADAETVSNNLMYSVTASNPNLFPEDNIFFESCSSCSTQTLLLTPVLDMAGASYITITVTDEHCGKASQQFTVTVKSVPDIPVLSDFNNYTITEDTPISIPFSLKDNDQLMSGTYQRNHQKYIDTSTITADFLNLSLIKKENLIITGFDAPQDNQIITSPGDTSTLTLSVTPIPDAFGSTDIVITATDSFNLTDTKRFLFTVTPVNDPPVISSITEQATFEDISLTINTICLKDVDSTSLTITAMVSDTEIVSVSDIVFIAEGMKKYDNIYTMTSESDDNSITANMDINITPMLNAFGTTDITICVSDGYFLTTQSFSLHITEINDPPVLKKITDLDTFLMVWDYEGYKYPYLRYMIWQQVEIPNEEISQRWDEISYTDKNYYPDTDFDKNDFIPGYVYSFKVSACAWDSCSEFSNTITHTIINDPPFILDIPDYTINKDETLLVQFMGGDTETSPYRLTYSVNVSNPNLFPENNVFFDFCSNCATHTLVLTPVTNMAGISFITITVTDEYGANTSHQFTVTVNSVSDSSNDPPEISSIKKQTIFEDTSFTIKSICLKDVDSKSLTITALVSDPGIVSVSDIVFKSEGIKKNDHIYNITSESEGISIIADIDICITPVENAFGDTGITICVDDGDLQTTSSFALHITEVNDPPLLLGIHDVITSEDTSISLSFQISDIEGSNRGEFIISTISSNTDLLDVSGIEYTGTHVTKANESFSVSIGQNITEDITLILHPKKDMYGIVQNITIALLDATVITTTSFTLTVMPPEMNIAPIVSDKNIGIDENKHRYIELHAIDSDDKELNYYIVSPPNHGSITKTNDIVLYTPDPYYYGPDRFTYKANDGKIDSNIATIMITIYNKYFPPIAYNQEITTCENMPVNITLTGFSPENEPLTFQIQNQPVHGTLSSATPHLTYTPDKHFYGTDNFTFYTYDNNSNSIPATVSITVKRRKTYVLNISGPHYGTVFLDPETVTLPWSGQYQADQEVCFKAKPYPDWIFINWTGDLQSTENPTCIILDKDKTITANMETKTFMLTIQSNEPKPITINQISHLLPFSKIYKIHSPITLENESDLFKCWEGVDLIFDNPYSFNINTDMTLTANYYPLPDWQTIIQIERSVEKYDTRQEALVFIGTASQAYANKTDDLPEKYSCDIVINNQVFEKLFKKNIQKNDRNEYQWVISVNPRGNIDNEFMPTTAKLSWNPLTFSSEGQYMLKSFTGETLISNMRETTEYEVSGNSYMIFNIIWKKHKIFYFHLRKGWNLISLPLTPSSTTISHLFPDYEAAFEFNNGSYYPVTNFIPGKGYWLKISSHRTFSISGQPFFSDTIDVSDTNDSDNWHLIGASHIEANLDTNLSIKVMYRYVNGNYEQTYTMKPGFGYWVKIE